jgi:large subunit ribosomal protein L21
VTGCQASGTEDTQLQEETAMYAVIQAGGKQYRVAPGDKVRVESIPVEVGGDIELNGVVAVMNDEGKLLAGNDLSGAKVLAKVTNHGRGDKIIVFKFKRKKQYKRTIGHRQDFTELTIGDVVL